MTHFQGFLAAYYSYVLSMTLFEQALAHRELLNLWKRFGIALPSLKQNLMRYIVSKLSSPNSSVVFSRLRPSRTLFSTRIRPAEYHCANKTNENCFHSLRILVYLGIAFLLKFPYLIDNCLYILYTSWFGSASSKTDGTYACWF